MTLRPYQSDLVRRFFESEKRRSLIVLPTGAGKTRVAASIVDHWPGRVIFIADRQEREAREAGILGCRRRVRVHPGAPARGEEVTEFAWFCLGFACGGIFVAGLLTLLRGAGK